MALRFVGSVNALSRHGVAALLNASHPAIHPTAGLDSPEEIVGLWQIAIDSANPTIIDATKNVFADSNEQGCVVDAHGDVIEEDLPNSDPDNEPDVYDNCPHEGNRNQDDSDRDGSGDPCDADDDNDGCFDWRELTDDPVRGGRRSPFDVWDFYDVTADQRIDLSDALALLTHFGESAIAVDPLLDRYVPDRSRPWRTAHSINDNGIDLTDVLANLESFGHSCRTD